MRVLVKVMVKVGEGGRVVWKVLQRRMAIKFFGKAHDASGCRERVTPSNDENNFLRLMWRLPGLQDLQTPLAFIYVIVDGDPSPRTLSPAQLHG